MQLVTESEVFQFKNGSTAEPAGNSHDYGTPMLKHPENTMAVNPKTPDFLAFSEFSVGTTENYPGLFACSCGKLATR